MVKANEAKLRLIELLQSLEGLPEHQREQFNGIIARLKKNDIVITSQEYQKIKLFLAAMFCGVKWPNFPMTPENKKKIHAADEWLDTPEHKTSAKNTRRKI